MLFEKGDKVCYCPPFKDSHDYRNGIVKSRYDTTDKYFVAFYTENTETPVPQIVSGKHLKMGWQISISSE